MMAAPRPQSVARRLRQKGAVEVQSRSVPPSSTESRGTARPSDCERAAQTAGANWSGLPQWAALPALAHVPERRAPTDGSHPRAFPAPAPAGQIPVPAAVRPAPVMQEPASGIFHVPDQRDHPHALLDTPRSSRPGSQPMRLRALDGEKRGASFASVMACSASCCRPAERRRRPRFRAAARKNSPCARAVLLRRAADRFRSTPCRTQKTAHSLRSASPASRLKRPGHSSAGCSPRMPQLHRRIAMSVKNSVFHQNASSDQPDFREPSCASRPAHRPQLRQTAAGAPSRAFRARAAAVCADALLLARVHKLPRFAEGVRFAQLDLHERSDIPDSGQ